MAAADAFVESGLYDAGVCTLIQSLRQIAARDLRIFELPLPPDTLTSGHSPTHIHTHKPPTSTHTYTHKPPTSTRTYTHKPPTSTHTYAHMSPQHTHTQHTYLPSTHSHTTHVSLHSTIHTYTHTYTSFQHSLTHNTHTSPTLNHPHPHNSHLPITDSHTCTHLPNIPLHTPTHIHSSAPYRFCMGVYAYMRRLSQLPPRRLLGWRPQCDRVCMPHKLMSPPPHPHPLSLSECCNNRPVALLMPHGSTACTPISRPPHTESTAVLRNTAMVLTSCTPATAAMNRCHSHSGPSFFLPPELR